MFCAKRKIGALIAIEREVGLGAVAENGVRLNAELTSTLLDTIFWPNSPLHDLGVIVSGGRIMYAGVQFPLAEPGDIERKLGSRHRAAVGMSQESDAVVLVVSEETGDVSVAESGKLIRKLTPDALRDLLFELLGGGNRPGASPDADLPLDDGAANAASSPALAPPSPAQSGVVHAEERATHRHDDTHADPRTETQSEAQTGTSGEPREEPAAAHS
jgi:hypothetical protein